MSDTRTGENDTSAPTAIPFATACRYWLELGFISFGGPAGQISMMHGELVERRRWISERRFLHALNFTMVLPGPEAQQLATYMGWLMHGTLGGIISGALFVLPSLAILLLLAWGYMAFGELQAVAAVLYGVKPAVTAIVIHAAVRIGKRALHHPLLVAIAVGAFLLLFFLDAPFPLIVAGAAIAGWLGSRFVPAAFTHGSVHGPSVVDAGRAIIDDDTPLPAHARFRWSSATLCLATGLGLWLLVEGALAAAFGWHGPLTQLGWFFTKAALVTFGGAYAVLPYVYQGAVEDYGWISTAQMIDGLALGETTPGPLIMVNTFVGFVAAWNEAALGADRLVAAGLAGGLVVTFVTFLPSFVFVLLGGPAVEATRHRVGFSAPLAGITAAVVGVIVSLALFFAWHVLWPRANAAAPFAGGFEWPSLILMLAALAGLWRFRLGVVPVLLACAVAGLGWHALRALV
jgi:chromate transporter